ncbi:hypothetical protein X975_00088, partial [Stegodyphus mimosarum]
MQEEYIQTSSNFQHPSVTPEIIFSLKGHRRAQVRAVVRGQEQHG